MYFGSVFRIKYDDHSRVIREANSAAQRAYSRIEPCSPRLLRRPSGRSESHPQSCVVGPHERSFRRLSCEICAAKLDDTADAVLADEDIVARTASLFIFL